MPDGVSFIGEASCHSLAPSCRVLDACRAHVKRITSRKFCRALEGVAVGRQPDETASSWPPSERLVKAERAGGRK